MRKVMNFSRACEACSTVLVKTLCRAKVCELERSEDP
jgi:hypothetical protein